MDFLSMDNFFSHNDINMLPRSSVFARLTEGNAPVVHYEINGYPYNKCYYFVDGIYPEWSTFEKIICEPTEEKIEGLSNNKRHARKSGACQFYYSAPCWSTDVMIACVMIMHNIIVEDKCD
jgi:hypothetical protein